MKLNIAVLAGDGIGPEIMKQGKAVMDGMPLQKSLDMNLFIMRLSVAQMQ